MPVCRAGRVTPLPCLLLLCAGLLAGCRNGLNTSCEWPGESPSSLDLRDPSHARHLVQDVALAEELAVRFGDSHWPPGPARRQGRDELCLTPLFQHVAGLHGVTLGDVHAARARVADRGLNLLVNGPVGVAILGLALVAVSFIKRRFSVTDEAVAVAGATAGCAVLIGSATIALGRLWEAVVETARVGNGHLSYRGLRLPWAQHSLEYAAVAVGVFVLFSVIYFLHARREQSDKRLQPGDLAISSTAPPSA